MFERYTEKAIKVVMLAQEEARLFGHHFVGSEQILLGLIGEDSGRAAKALKAMGVNLENTREEVEKIAGRGSGFIPMEIPFTPAAKQVLELTKDEAKQLGHNYIDTEHLLLGLVRAEADGAHRVLENLGVDLIHVRTYMLRILEQSGATATQQASPPPVKPANLAKLVGFDKFWTDLTAMASEGTLDPVVDREPEIEWVMSVLTMRSKANPLLIGEPGVGKSAIIRGVAARIAAFDVHDFLQEKRIILLDFQHILVYRDAAKILRECLEIAKENNIILVINELHVLLDPRFKDSREEGMVSTLNWFLKFNKVNCIGIASLSNILPHFQKDSEFLQNFQPLFVRSSSPEEAVKVLLSQRPRLEQYHKILISDDAINLAVSLSSKTKKGNLPEQAMVVLDDACALVKLRTNHVRNPTEIQRDLNACVATSGDIRKNESMRILDEELKESTMKTTVSAQDIEKVVCDWTS